ncbi:MAG: hypothetical protein K2Z81_10595 [Cyanobacteria bacterium]|jgi:hypothetical protein|nr:hypothetical protein [Cyanobacteriota bacterium]
MSLQHWKFASRQLILWLFLLINIVNAPVQAEPQAESPRTLSGRVIIDDNARPANVSRGDAGTISSPKLVYLMKGDLEIYRVFEMVQGKENAATIYAHFTHLENWLQAHPELQPLAEELKQANADPLGIPIYTKAGWNIHKGEPGYLIHQHNCGRYPPTPALNFGNVVLVLKAEVIPQHRHYCNGLDYIVEVTYTVR